MKNNLESTDISTTTVHNVSLQVPLTENGCPALFGNHSNVNDNVAWSGEVSNYFVGGYVCSICSAWVSPGQMHACGTWVTPATPVSGHYCPTCLAWVDSGLPHSCATLPYQLTTFPKVEMKPHLCPVCQGLGAVRFDPANPLAASRDRESWPCKPCTGSGVLWQ